MSYFSNENRIKYLLDKGVTKEKIKCMDHHLAYAASAYFGIGDKDDKLFLK